MAILSGRRIGRRDPPSWQPRCRSSPPAPTWCSCNSRRTCIRDATGVWLKAYVVDAIYYILSFVDASITKNVVINVSYGPTTGPHDGTALLESALTDLVTIFDGSPGKPKLEISLAAGNAYLSEGHMACTRKTVPGPDHVEWTWRIPPDNSVLCFAEVWMKKNDASGVVVTLTSPSGLTSTSTTGSIPFRPPAFPFPSFTGGVHAPLAWG